MRGNTATSAPDGEQPVHTGDTHIIVLPGLYPDISPGHIWQDPLHALDACACTGMQCAPGMAAVFAELQWSAAHLMGRC